MYDQLYAQLKYEVEVERQRYFLTKEEELELMKHNLRYQRMNGLGEMLLALFEKPEGTSKEQPDNGRWVAVEGISPDYTPWAIRAACCRAGLPVSVRGRWSTWR